MIQLKRLNETDNDCARQELNACLLLLVIKQTLLSRAAYSAVIAGRNDEEALQADGHFYQVLNARALASGIFQPRLTIYSTLFNISISKSEAFNSKHQ